MADFGAAFGPPPGRIAATPSTQLNRGAKIEFRFLVETAAVPCCHICPYLFFPRPFSKFLFLSSPCYRRRGHCFNGWAAHPGSQRSHPVRYGYCPGLFRPVSSVKSLGRGVLVHVSKASARKRSCMARLFRGGQKLLFRAVVWRWHWTERIVCFQPRDEFQTPTSWCILRYLLQVDGRCLGFGSSASSAHDVVATASAAFFV